MNKRYKLLILLLILINSSIWLTMHKLTNKQTADFFPEKMQAISLAQKAQAVIGTRLLGEEFTFATTTLAPLKAKELSTHPDFAALAVDYLLQAGVQPTDKVAVNLSGSFPGINIAALAAIDSIGAQPLIISSVGASTWGANRPDYSWLDMENQLAAAEIGNWKSLAASLGGINDNGGGLMPEGKLLLRQAIERTDRPLLNPNNLQQAIQTRLDIYRQHNNGQLPKVLLNVGGNHVIFGKMGHKVPLKEGLSQGYDFTLNKHDGLAQEFIKNNRPVIHFINIERLAAKHNIKPGVIAQSSILYTQKTKTWQKLLLSVLVLSNFIILYKFKTQE